jgi:outer membrane lipoprotein-sorting protein
VSHAFLCRLALLCAVLAAASRAHAEPLSEILARMDRSAQEFKAVTAKLRRVSYTAVIDESSEINGEMRLKRAKGGTVGIVEFSEPEPRVFHFSGRELQVYYPKAKTVEIYDAEKYTKTMDQVLLLGFGTSGAELKKSYDIKAGGAEMVGSEHATRIELTPKSSELRKLIVKVELWISEGQSNPAQAKFTEPSKNYELATYSDVKLNPELADSAFELKLPAGVKKLTPQK